MSPLERQVRDLVELFDDHEYMAASKRRKAQILSFEVTEAACFIMKDLSPDEADATVYNLIETTEKVYDEYLVSINLLPGDFIEDFIEQVARPYISDGIMKYFNHLNF